MTAQDNPYQLILVDDEDKILKVNESIFKQWYNVHCYTSAQALLKDLDNITPTAFILDWLMPGMTGLDLCRELRKHARFDFVPIAFYTAVRPGLASVNQVFDAGGQIFLSKGGDVGVTVSQVRAMIDSYIRLQQNMMMSATMLSVLKHDLSNALTGVVTGLEVMSMDPAFQEPNLMGQMDNVRSWGDDMRGLIADISQVLHHGPNDPKPACDDTCAALIFGHLDIFLAGKKEGVRQECLAEKVIQAPAPTIARILFYLLQHARTVVPDGTSLTVYAIDQEEQVEFGIRFEGNQQEEFETAFTGPVCPERWLARRSVLPIQYVRNALGQLELTLQASFADNKTLVSFKV